MTVPESKRAIVEAQLRAMAEKHGAITAEMVLSEASRKRSPLHPFFVWDDSKAARQYRLIQAGEMIRQIKVTYEPTEDRTVRVRAFHHVTQTTINAEGEAEESGIFVTLETALSVESYRDQLLKNCRRDMESFRQKYSALNEVSHVIEAIDSARIP